MINSCKFDQEVLKARDQKQLDFEELSGYLHQTIQERERVQNPDRKYSQREGRLHITEYVTDKYNDFIGVNPETARRDKLHRLYDRVAEVNILIITCQKEKSP